MLVQWHILTPMTGEHLKDHKHHTLYVQLTSASDMFRTAIGAHPDQRVCPWGLFDGFVLMFI
jgi:hypothetical protein